MMGIYIKGMEMPDIGSYLVVIDNNTPGKTFITFKHAYDSRQIVGSYEAIPVPPHGRLIDADKLGIRDAEKQAYEAYLREKDEDFIEEPIIEYHRGYLEGLTHASGRVKFAPTIIPADEEEA